MKITSNASEAPLTDFTQTLESTFEKTVQNYQANPIPELDKSKTAVFTSDWNGEDYPYQESELQSKIADDFTRLIGMGYDIMIVNTGTRYGMLALKMLGAKKKETPFRLILAKVRGEMLEEPNIQVAMLMENCDSFWYADNAEHYGEVILSRTSYVSDETGLRVI